MDDLISRKAAIDECNKRGAEHIGYAIAHLPSAQQKPLKYTGDSICLYCKTVNCDGCMYEPVMGV